MLLAVIAFTAAQAPVFVVRPVEPMPIAKGKAMVAMPTFAGRLPARAPLAPPSKRPLGP